MNPFERWDDWEWERAIQEVGKEHSSGRQRSPSRTGWGNLFKHWNGTQKRVGIAALLFLTIFFSANSEDPVSQAIHSIYHGAMNSGNYYEALNGMAKDTLSLGGVNSPGLPVDAGMQGQLWPPISGAVAAGFGQVGKGGMNAAGSVHEGIDVESSLGTPVVSPASGVITFVGMDPQLGKIIKLDFGDGWTSVLGNLGGISVQKGERVEKGQTLATVGLSAPLKKPWLHFELRKDNKPVNPLPYLATAKTKN